MAVRPTNSPAQIAATADNNIGVLWIVGLLLLVAGAIVAGLNIPGEEIGFSGEIEETGNGAIFGIALLAAGAGQLMVAAGVVATGVSLGIRATRNH